MRKHELGVGLVRKVHPPHGITAFGGSYRVGLVRILAADRDRYEVLLAAEDLEPHEAAQFMLALEARIDRVGCPDEPVAQPDVAGGIGHSVPDGLARALASSSGR